MAHTNGMESFWTTLKRAHKGVYHKDQPEAPGPLRAAVRGQAQRPGGRNDCPNAERVVVGMVGKRLIYRELIS